MNNNIQGKLLIATISRSPDVLKSNERLNEPGHRPGPHNPGGVDDVIDGDVAVVLDVLDLLAVPWRLLQGLDDEGGGRRNHRDLDIKI